MKTNAPRGRRFTPSTYETELGTALRSFMTEHGISVRSLATEADVSPATIWNKVTAHTSPLEIGNIEAIARLAHTTPQWLLSEMHRRMEATRRMHEA